MIAAALRDLCAHRVAAREESARPQPADPIISRYSTTSARPICRSLRLTSANNKLHIYTAGIYKSNDHAMGSRQPTDPAYPTARICEGPERTGGSVVIFTDRRKSATATSAYARRTIPGT